MDELIHEGVIAGIPAFEIMDWTLAEIIEQVRAYNDRRRRECQQLARIAYGESGMIAVRFGGKGQQIPEIWEVFPFWTDEEVREFRVEKYRRIMEKYAATGGGTRA